MLMRRQEIWRDAIFCRIGDYDFSPFIAALDFWGCWIWAERLQLQLRNAITIFAGGFHSPHLLRALWTTTYNNNNNVQNSSKYVQYISSHFNTSSHRFLVRSILHSHPMAPVLCQTVEQKRLLSFLEENRLLSLWPKTWLSTCQRQAALCAEFRHGCWLLYSYITICNKFGNNVFNVFNDI